MKPDEKLIYFLTEHRRRAIESGAIPRGEHLRDADFIRLIKNAPRIEEILSNGEKNGDRELSAASEHLAGCDFCLTEFRDFYDFFTPIEADEPALSAAETENIWHGVAARLPVKQNTPKFWTRIFSAKQNIFSLPALSWGLAALFLICAVTAAFVAWRSQNSQTELAKQLQSQQQVYEERLKTLENAAPKNDSGEQEKNRLEAEKAELQQQIAELQAKIERANEPKQTERGARPQVSNPSNPAEDNSFVAVNTPIYDVFPSDSAVRGNTGDAKNKLTIPNNAKNAVLILNNEAPDEIKDSRGELVSDSGKIVWRSGGLKRDSHGNFTLTFPRSVLKNGKYRLTLFGQNQSGARRTIAEYTIAVQNQ